MDAGKLVSVAPLIHACFDAVELQRAVKTNSGKVTQRGITQSRLNGTARLCPAEDGWIAGRAPRVVPSITRPSSDSSARSERGPALSVAMGSDWRRRSSSNQMKGAECPGDCIRIPRP